jgi:hypothetical protein
MSYFSGAVLFPSPAFSRGSGRLDRLSLLLLRQALQPGEGAAGAGNASKTASTFLRIRCPHREVGAARSTLTCASQRLRAAIATAAPRFLSHEKMWERGRHRSAA